MKLWTEMESCLPRGSIGDIEHDAATAHALLQAMQEWGERSYSEAVDKLDVRWIRLRASELMAEWCFSSTPG